jgi:uncharacterized protein (DUF849 family)
VFGILGGIGTAPEDVAHMKRTADRLFGKSYKWSLLAARASQLPIAVQSVALGGNLWVGLEDRLWTGKSRFASSNSEQTMLARKIIEALGLEVATPDDARAMLGFKGAYKVGF